MGKTDQIDLKQFVTKTMHGVFDTMLSMEASLIEGEAPAIEGERIIGSVGMTGDITGLVCIQVRFDFARLLTATILGMEVEEIEGTEEVRDVIGEMSNMIAGNLKSTFCDIGLPCVLSIPSITHGTNFNVASMKGTLRELYYFRHGDNVSEIEVVLKA